MQPPPPSHTHTHTHTLPCTQWTSGRHRSPGLEAQTNEGDRTGSPVPQAVLGDGEPGRMWREGRG